MPRTADRRGFQALATLLATAVSGSACLASPSVDPTPRPPPRSTPYAEMPAAGICADSAGTEVVMTLEPGIPDPRCLIVSPAQHLRLVNHTGGTIDVTLGRLGSSLQSDAEVVFDAPFGDYLLPGVHAVWVDPCCGGEIWLRGG